MDKIIEFVRMLRLYGDVIGIGLGILSVPVIIILIIVGNKKKK